LPPLIALSKAEKIEEEEMLGGGALLSPLPLLPQDVKKIKPRTIKPNVVKPNHIVALITIASYSENYTAFFAK
jgi:hypothetical protein